jgi:AcrR family transcriptional regulator
MTSRSEAKADRRSALLRAAAALFARRGYNGVSLEDLGAAVEVSGPAVYRHFAGKQAVLAALLIGVSEDLLEGGTAVVAGATEARATLLALVRFQVEFALDNSDVIRVQDRDLDSLTESDRRRVRQLQLRYLDLWIVQLGRHMPALGTDAVRIRVRAAFGLINSTPHSVQPRGVAFDRERARLELETMAMAALEATPVP